MDELNKLKELLLGNEKRALDALTRRLEKPETRAADIADVLPQSISRSHQNSDRLVRSMRAPVDECVKDSVRERPQEFADALYPVMGPAIRKSIAETLKAWVQTTNQAVEQTLSPQALKWRFDAWRSGLSYGEYLLQKNLIFRVEEVFLISPENGLMIGHARHAEASTKDEDAVSAMFTAIQDFVKDSFVMDSSEGLESAELGEFTLWAVHGPYAVLACVIRGLPPKSLRTELTETLERIHLEFGDALSSFSGDRRSVVGLESKLAECLRFENRAEPRDSKRTSLPFFILLSAFTFLIVIWLAYSIMQTRMESRLRNALMDEPGIFVSGLEREDGFFVVQGLRDPLAVSMTEVAKGVGITSDEIRDELRPYQSLETDIVRRRAEQGLQPPNGVHLELTEDGVLIISGTASAIWREEAGQKALLLPGITAARFEMSGVSPSDADLLEAVRDALAPPAGVNLKIVSAQLSVSGVARNDWVESAERLLPNIEGLSAYDTHGLISAERQELDILLVELNQTSIRFVEDARLRADAQTQIAVMTERLQKVAELSATLNLQPRIVLTGHTDSSGSLQANRILAQQRAFLVQQQLISAEGIQADWISTLAADPETEFGSSAPEQRRVDLSIDLIDPAAGGTR